MTMITKVLTSIPELNRQNTFSALQTLAELSQVSKLPALTEFKGVIRFVPELENTLEIQLNQSDSENTLQCSIHDPINIGDHFVTPVYNVPRYWNWFRSRLFSPLIHGFSYPCEYFPIQILFTEWKPNNSNNSNSNSNSNIVQPVKWLENKSICGFPTDKVVAVCMNGSQNNFTWPSQTKQVDICSMEYKNQVALWQLLQETHPFLFNYPAKKLQTIQKMERVVAAAVFLAQSQGSSFSNATPDLLVAQINQFNLLDNLMFLFAGHVCRCMYYYHDADQRKYYLTEIVQEIVHSLLSILRKNVEIGNVSDVSEFLSSLMPMFESEFEIISVYFLSSSCVKSNSNDQFIQDLVRLCLEMLEKCLYSTTATNSLHS
jgi:hypothetical protein